MKQDASTPMSKQLNASSYLGQKQNTVACWWMMGAPTKRGSSSSSSAVHPRASVDYVSLGISERTQRKPLALTSAMLMLSLSFRLICKTRPRPSSLLSRLGAKVPMSCSVVPDARGLVLASSHQQDLRDAPPAFR